jgi:hypothetical protein
MTEKQDKLYWREWAAVRAAWPDANRHELHARALGQDKSHTLFSNDDFDRVLGVFRALSRPADLDSQLRQLRQVKTRLIWKITVEQVALLAVFMTGDHEIDRQAAAENYVLSVMRARFHTDRIESLTHGHGDELGQLEMLRDTIAARINELRKKRGLTGHDLAQLAGQKCACKECSRQRLDEAA